MPVFLSPRKLWLSALLILLGGISLCLIKPLQASRFSDAKMDVALRQLYREHTGARKQSFEARQSTASPHIRINQTTNSVGVILRLRDEGEATQRELTLAGVRVRERIGDIAIAEVLVQDLANIAALDAVSQIHAAHYKKALSAATPLLSGLTFVNDAANAAIKAPQARAEFNVTGSGVVIGVVDTGIDWRHGDFRTVDGKTRIKALWDMSDATGTGPGGVGRVFTEAEINSALQNSGAVGERDLNGHGSNVAGAAAGNGFGAGNGMSPSAYAGIAPEADLIVVKATRSTNEQAYFADDDVIAALSFVRNQATILNEPFVINLSIGGHYSAHDGTDPLEVAIDNLLASGKGKQVIVAAGNEGEDNIHAGGIFEEGKDVVLPFTLSNQASGMLVVYQGADAVSARIIKPNGVVVGPVSLYGLITNDPDVELENAIGETATDPKAVIVTFKQRPAGIWKLLLTGTRVNNGRFDVWTQDAGATQLDASVSDNSCSVNSPATSRKAISVGNFVTKTQYLDLNGTLRTRTQQGQVGQIALSSSLGPSRDGRLMPLLAAPGTYLASTRSADQTIDPTTGNQISAENLTNDGGKHYVSYGSSLSAATVTGTVALMLQANRNLTADQIRRLLMRTAATDNFTNATISPQFGYGKLNAEAAIQAAIENSAEMVSVSGASFMPETVGAPEMMMSGFGANLTTETAKANEVPLPTTLGNVSVRLIDSAGITHTAPLFYVSPGQINYLLPASLGVGLAKIEVVKTDNTVVARGTVSVNNVWPGLFSFAQNGRGLAAADVLRIKANGERSYESISNPINLSNATDKVYVQLYGTGLRGRTNLSNVKLTLGGTPLAIEYVGSQNFYVGLDQVNAVIPNSLAGRNRTLDLVLYVNGWAANVVQCKIQ